MSKYTITSADKPLAVRAPRVFPVHEGKGIIVTGGSGGIGRAIVRQLLDEGARVVLADRDAAVAEEAAAAFGGSETGCFPLAMDVGSERAVAEGIASAIATLGRVDGLVNCAAIVRHSDPLAIPRSDWQRQFEINLFGAYETSRLVATHMIETGAPGAIVSIASEAGKKGHKESLAYSTSKAALISMTRMLAETLAPHDINVNCVCPGGVATPMLHEVSVAYSGFTGEAAPAIFDKMVSQQLLRHLEPIEVARVVSFLLSDNAMLVRGQAINADAGETPY